MTKEQVALLGSGGAGGVKDSLTVIVADGFSKAFLWAVPFADTAYRMGMAVYATAATSGVVVTVREGTKTALGFTLDFSAAFDGHIEFVAVA
jgi:hypothetical protein